MSFDLKNIVFGIIIGIIIMLFIGNVDIQTDIVLGNNDKEEKNIQISVDKIIENDNEIVQISIEAEGAVDKKDIDKELEKLYAKYDIDPTSDNLKIEIEIEDKIR